MNKDRIKDILSHPLSVLIFTILCLIFIFSLRESAKKAQVSKESIQKLEQSVNQMETELKNEQEKSADAQSDLSTEKIIRNELLQKKEGETILQIPDRDDSGSTDEEKLEKTGPLDEWRELLF